MNDLTLALMGVSAGVGSAVGAWVALWWRDRVPTSQRHLVRKVYVHVDEIIGATKTENLRRANRRFKVQRWLGRGTSGKGRKKLGTAIADFFWPMPQLGTGTAALPSISRMGHYVKVSPDRRTWSIRHTSEAPANNPTFVEWLEKGRPTSGGGLAQALGLEWRPGMFEVSRNWSEALVRLTLAKAADVPDQVTADEELV